VRSKRLEIKKVLGEENPADRFTKHSLSKDRLDKLVELFDCQFRDGRAETAPRTRTGPSDKKTMAQADTIVGSIQEACPVMPHIQMSPAELEEEYPSLVVVDDLDLPDLSRLEDEKLYAAGMKVVQDILHEMTEIGRTRKQGITGDSRENRYPVQPRESQVVPRASGPGAKESRRRCVDSASGIGATEDASHTERQLPLCDRDGFDRVGTESRIVYNSQVRSRSVQGDSLSGSTESGKEHSQANPFPPEGDNFVSLFGFSSLPRGRTADGAQYFSYYDKALPKQVSTEQVGNL
jgi:hypothetical protein